MQRHILRLCSLAFVLGVAACSDSSAPRFLAHDEAGAEPFLTIERDATPTDLLTVLEMSAAAADEAEAALVLDGSEPATIVFETRLDAAAASLTAAGFSLIRPRSSVGVGILPIRESAVCELDTIAQAYENDREAAVAFASVHAIATEAIGEYLESLIAGFLIEQVTVQNHRLRNGLAEGYLTTLSAGTAVLVDDDGLPHVRCRSGDPLLPAQIDLDGTLVKINAFADRVADSRIADDVPPITENAVDGVFTDDPRQSLGPPNRSATSLGDDDRSDEGRGGDGGGGDGGSSDCPYFLVLEFVDNRLVDGPGDDLQIIELGRSEPMFVAIGTSPDQLRTVGSISGGTSSIDISGVAEEGEEFAYVRICDGPDNNSEIPGSDIDAVAALNSVDA